MYFGARLSVNYLLMIRMMSEIEMSNHGAGAETVYGTRVKPSSFLSKAGDAAGRILKSRRFKFDHSLKGLSFRFITFGDCLAHSASVMIHDIVDLQCPCCLHAHMSTSCLAHNVIAGPGGIHTRLSKNFVLSKIAFSQPEHDR